MGPHQLSPHYCITPTNNRRVKAHIIQCHAPTNGAVGDVKARSYDSLNHLLGRVGARDFIILMGDFNAKIGGWNEGYEEVMGKHGVGKMNENGECLLRPVSRTTWSLEEVYSLTKPYIKQRGCHQTMLQKTKWITSVSVGSSEGPWKMSEPEEEQMQHLTTICR
ncbi:hypothetical protein NHX12_024666 [Muraenolepis orangiensis]|uniref:Endonuclease/exonuclease/phosphatase domain-containing protein n=1 Tax=Muraenolepis orangiensis TaxID=630683 RepID=A0A9Q0IRI8_9TELE|nr:hypothetical protein NHX12_024666 [Muraenolepis orangiensis]